MGDNIDKEEKERAGCRKTQGQTAESREQGNDWMIERKMINGIGEEKAVEREGGEKRQIQSHHGPQWERYEGRKGAHTEEWGCVGRACRGIKKSRRR